MRVSIHSFLYEIISALARASALGQDHTNNKFLYEIISALARAQAPWDKTMQTITIYNFLYEIISALARASALYMIMKLLVFIVFCMI